MFWNRTQEEETVALLRAVKVQKSATDEAYEAFERALREKVLKEKERD